MATHVADQPLAGQIEGAFRRGARTGAIAAADLATSATVAKANVDTRVRTMHVADQVHGIPVKDAIDKVDGVLGSGLVSGGSLDNIYAANPGTWDDTGTVL